MRLTFKEFLNETTQLTIDDLLSPEEQQAAMQAIKADQSTEEFERLASQRIREKGMNVPLNISAFLKWKHQIDREMNPKKFQTPDVSGAWDSYGKARQRGEVQGIGPGGSRNWTGD